ncbi:sirohydrochlorin cobaltochelatase [Desulfobulbus elongatus]|uniref:sirohydrochlorin cobaltochelatase n=1 Tax=Desulfobulbus elongatus TaxID=53332 RepID=UPI000552AA58|nr:sirohydrochlorin cobaltochelatase [Desulfobulbus elongatus]
MHENTAIVLATFGTTVETALGGVLAIRDTMAAAFPHTRVKLAFTSNQVRRIWHRRAADAAYVAAHPEVPREILSIEGILAAVAILQDRGFTAQVVQPTHVVPAEEFHDLTAYVRGLLSIRTMKPRWRPFKAIALGRPLLGAYSPDRPYADDIRILARALADDAALAREHGAALIYMGHGNRYFPSGGLYLEFAARMRQFYPEVLTLIGTVEGFPAFDEVLADLRLHGVRRAVIKPLLIVAGEHATRDLAGPQEDSWRSMLGREGIEAVPVPRGLGEHPAVARIFVEHAAQAAAEAGVELR